MEGVPESLTGTCLRTERLRTTLGQTTLGKECVEILRYSSNEEMDCTALHEAQVELLRTLANLCIDHDENRTVLLQCQAPQAIIGHIQSILVSHQDTFSVTIVNLLRTATGALLNLQLDHPDTRLALRQDKVSMETLLQLAIDERVYVVGDWYSFRLGLLQDEGKRKVSTGASLMAWSWRILQDVCANESKEQDGESGGAREEEEEEVDKAIESLVAIGADKVTKYLITPLKSFVSKPVTATVSGPWSAEDVSDLMESDMDVLQIATELLEACSLDSKSFRLSSLTASGSADYHSNLDFLMHFLDLANPPLAWSVDRAEGDDESLPPRPSDADSARELQSQFGRAKAAVAKAVVCIAGEDDNMGLLFEAKENWFMDTLKDWMSRDVKERDDLVSTSMLAMGNLARKGECSCTLGIRACADFGTYHIDSHCLALVHQHGLVPTLTTLLTASADIKVAHGIVCLLKNLSIPPDNKLVIGSKYGTMTRLSPYMSADMDKVQPLQFATVGLLKHLCAGCGENAVALVSEGDTLDVLLQLIQRTEDVPTRMEGTRVLVNVTKTLWSTSAGPERMQARQRLVSSSVTAALAEMVRSSPKYPVLVNEGILAMTLIASDRERNGAQLVADALLSDPSSIRDSPASTDTQAAVQPAPLPPPPATLSSSVPQPPEPSRAPAGTNERQPLGPTRRATMDSTASQSSKSLPPPRTSAEMISNVLARRDARMPPQFASNACVFVQTLVDGGRRSSSSKSHDDAIRRVLHTWTKDLGQLSEVGPQETIVLAKKSLKSTIDYLALA